jgi:hypothetical protein
MLKQLTLIPEGGMCNRLRAVGAARRLCARSGARCSIVWNWGEFSDFFAAAPDVEIVPDLCEPAPGRIRISSSDKTIDATASSLEVQSGNLFWAKSESPISYSQIAGFVPRLSDPLARIVADFRKEHFRNTVGFHIRRTDNPKSRQYSPDPLFVEQGRQAVENGKTIFLCTDNVETEEKLRQLFSPAVMIYPKRNRLPQRWPRSFNKIDTEDDLIDLFLLSQTEYVQGSYWSSFSGLAIALNGSTHSKILQIP